MDGISSSEEYLSAAKGWHAARGEFTQHERTSPAGNDEPKSGSGSFGSAATL